MSERFNNFESGPGEAESVDKAIEAITKPENLLTKNEIVYKLKSEGLTDENLQYVRKWTEIEEGHVVTERDRLLLDFQRVEFYLAAGDDDGAWESAQEALAHAELEKDEEICEKIRALFPGITPKDFTI